jgi:hypothetical protein
MGNMTDEDVEPIDPKPPGLCARKAVDAFRELGPSLRLASEEFF